MTKCFMYPYENGTYGEELVHCTDGWEYSKEQMDTSIVTEVIYYLFHRKINLNYIITCLSFSVFVKIKKTSTIKHQSSDLGSAVHP